MQSTLTKSYLTVNYMNWEGTCPCYRKYHKSAVGVYESSKEA